MDLGGTRPWRVEGRTMQEAIVESNAGSGYRDSIDLNENENQMLPTPQEYFLALFHQQYSMLAPDSILPPASMQSSQRMDDVQDAFMPCGYKFRGTPTWM